MESALILVFTINSIIHLKEAYYRVPPAKSLTQSTTKLIICPLLLIYFLMKIKRKKASLSKSDKYIAFGLFLGALGDLLLESHNQNIFLIGLVSFLIGHIMYSISIINWLGGMKDIKKYLLIQFSLFSIYFVYFYQVYYKHMKPEMILPAFIYGCMVFIFIGISMYSLFMNYSLKAFCFVLCSALFCLSDSILSDTLFIKQIYKADIYIMSTYILAQVTLVIGGLL
ncbi:MAG: lysoplasmalogenase [archaeon]|nr:lysoplasmalogenase [archaeon]